MQEIYEVALNLILHAGDSKSNSMMAIKATREGRFEEAQQLIDAAQMGLTEAHHVQTDLIQSEAQGKSVEVNLILTHAQDHLSMALMTLERAKEAKEMYQIISNLESKIDYLRRGFNE